MTMTAFTHNAAQKYIKGTVTAVTNVYVGPIISTVTKDYIDGWIELGSTDPGNQGATVKPDVIDAEFGTPITVQESHAGKWAGDLNFKLQEYTQEAIGYAIGTTIPTQFVVDSTNTETISASPAPTTTTFTLDSNAAGIKAGDSIRIEMSSATYGGPNYVVRRVQSVSTLAITIKGRLPLPPASGAKVEKITSAERYLGGNEFAKFQCISQTYLNNGDRVQWHFPECQSVAGINPGYGDKLVTLPIQMRANGQQTTIAGMSVDQVTLGTHKIIYAA